MSKILETMMSELGGGTLSSLGQAVGATPQQTQAMVGAALPALISSLAHNASSEGGAGALAAALDRDHQPNLMDQLSSVAGGSAAGGLGALLGGGGAGGALGALLPAALSMLQGGQSSVPKALDGGGILGHILGNSQENVASNAARASGVDPQMMLKFLPLLAPIVMSALGTLKAKQGLDSSGLSGLLQSEQQQLGAPPASDGFGVDDLLRVGGALAQSGVLGKLFN